MTLNKPTGQISRWLSFAPRVASSTANSQVSAYIDEFEYIPIDDESTRLLFPVIADGYEKRSLVLSTNLVFSRWGAAVFGYPTMTAAVIDRIVHHGRLLQFRGESYCVKNALMK